MQISDKNNIELLRTMKRIRTFDETCQKLFVAGRIPGALHCYTGEEAIATGVCKVLEPSDYILSTHRGHGHLIAKGGEFKYMLAELFGKSTGYCKGMGGSMHLASVKHGILGANGIVGGGICIAAGVGFSIKYQGTDQVVVCFFGDGGISTGFFHEGLNLASIHNAPVVFVCENNLYSISMTSKRATGLDKLSTRAVSYNMPGETVDGNDILAVYESAYNAIERARAGKGPTLLEYITYRWRGHHAGEAGDGLFYREKKELESWKTKDPIRRYQALLLKEGKITEEKIEKMEMDIQQEMDDAIEFANNSPYPKAESIIELSMLKKE
ncbi:MAG: thiamine pyrophosphate-dependent dehydrogenase E1 component subunit alpha [Spirochaetota bacterium]|nr:MAG: thiamine pyrophosphate-dependent dehydrogenase E1 component subunit alpha [Spirochaetota bacterium]